MAWADDFTVAANGNITHTSGSTNYSVEETYDALQDLADNASSTGDDIMDITMPNPSNFSYSKLITMNSPYNFDDTAMQYIYGGSIVQDDGDTIYEGFVNYGTQGMHIEVMQNGALVTPNFWTTGINADAANNISHRFTLKVRSGGVDIDGRRLIGMNREFGYTYKESIVNGSSRGENVFSLEQVDDINNNTAAGTVATWTGITNVEGYQGIDVNNDTTDEYYYSQYNKDIYTINQLIERLKYDTRRGTSETMYGLAGDVFRGITHEITVDGPTGTFNAVEPVSWSTTGSITAFADAGGGQVTVTSAAHGLANEGEVVITGTTNYNGTFNVANVTTNTYEITDTWVSDDATGTWVHEVGTGQMFAINSTTAATKMWIQLLTGVAPSDDEVITGTTSSATATTNVTVTTRSISAPFCGISTGDNIIGAYGVGIEKADLSSSDKVKDLTDTTITPPNNVTTGLGNLVSGDEVLMTNNNGGAVDYAQFTLNGALSSATTTAVVINGSIPADTPANNFSIRVNNDNGVNIKCDVTSWTGSTFTITSTDFSVVGAANGNNAFIGYIDDTSSGANIDFTSVYLAGRTFFYHVRNRGTLLTPAKGTVTHGSSVDIQRGSDA